jgi:hypothetical protein
MLGLQTIKTHKEHTASVKWELAYHNEHTAFLQTIINYSTAATQARDADAANKARVEREQQAISQKSDQAYEARIADARARAERLRLDLETARAHQGGPGAAPVPGLRDPAGGPYGPTAETGLPPGDALVATEQAIQLDELIKWVNGQMRIDLNGEPN